MQQEQLLLILKILTTLSWEVSLFLSGWVWGKEKSLETKQVVLVAIQGTMTILLIMLYLILDLTFSIKLIP